MTLRRFSSLKPSRGGVGMKSRTTVDNLVALCAECHRVKTENGKVRRPELLRYLEAVS